MQRKNPTYALIAGLALVAWMTSGSYFYASQCCDAIGKESYTGQLLIQDGNSFRVEHNEVLAFAKNSSQLILSKKLSDELIKVVRYVKSNPIKRLTLVGLFLGSEEGGAELGRARAEAMRTIFMEAGTPDYQIRTEVGRRDNLPQDNTGQVLLGGIDFIFDCLAPFKVSDPAYRFTLKANDNFVFDYNSVQFLMPLSEVMQIQVQALATYLKEHPDRQLTLTGYNHPDETHYGSRINLGWARANALRGLLVTAGAPTTQLLVKGISEERLAVLPSDLYDQFLPNAMGFEFGTLSEKRVKALEKEIAAAELALKKRQVFRFKDFGVKENKIVIDEDLKTYLNELILYLSSAPKAVIYVVGHSNTLITKEESALKGRERANYVRTFLVEQGILPARIRTTTAGDSHPLGRRETKYGQQINRRVDLFLSYDGKEPQLYALPPVSMEEEPVEEPKKNETKRSDYKKPTSKPTTTDSVQQAAPSVEKETPVKTDSVVTDLSKTTQDTVQ